MSAGDDQRDGREGGLGLGHGLEGLLALHPGRVDVGLDMIDSDEGDSPGQGQALGGAQAHQQGSDEAGSVSYGDGVDVRGRILVVPAAGIVEGALDEAGDDLHMSPAGDLRHHPAEALMQRHLAEDAIGEDAVAIFDDGDTGLIAGSFDSEDFHIGNARPLREASVTCQHRSTAVKEQAQAGVPYGIFFLPR